MGQFTDHSMIINQNVSFEQHSKTLTPSVSVCLLTGEMNPVLRPFTTLLFVFLSSVWGRFSISFQWMKNRTVNRKNRRFKCENLHLHWVIEVMVRSFLLQNRVCWLKRDYTGDANNKLFSGAEMMSPEPPSPFFFKNVIHVWQFFFQSYYFTFQMFNISFKVTRCTLILKLFWLVSIHVNLVWPPHSSVYSACSQSKTLKDGGSGGGWRGWRQRRKKGTNRFDFDSQFSLICQSTKFK